MLTRVCLNKVVVKSYPSTAHVSYKSEYEAFNNLQESSRPCRHIIQCHGAYYYHSRQDGSIVYSLVLEHADRGSLLDFYERVPPPQAPGQEVQFWRSLIQFLRAVEKIHNEMPEGLDGARYGQLSSCH